MEFKEEYCIDLFKIFVSLKDQQIGNETSFFEKYFHFREQFISYISSKKSKPSISIDVGNGENKF